MRELKITITLVFSFVASLNLLSQNKTPDVQQYNRQFIINYSQREYGDSCAPLNWSITQDNREIMYFGNAYRVLQFDGINWDATRTTLHGTYVTALHSDKDGKIYIGANGEFGFLDNSDNGKKIYKSLSDSLPIEDSFFSNVWRIFDYKGSVLFFSQEQIFIWDGNEIEIIHPETSFHLAFVVNDELYVRQREIGLMKYDGNSFVLVNDGGIFKNYGIFGLFPDNNGDILIVTQEIGLYKYLNKKDKGQIVSIKTPYLNYLNNSQIIGGTILHDGNIALNTVRNGVIIINHNGIVKFVIDQNSGLRDNEVKQVYQDKNNQLWLALNTGISMVNYNSGVSVFDYNTGLFGTMQSVAIHNNELFAGTSIGLFKMSKRPTDRIFKFFSQIEGFNASVNELLSVGNTLIIGSREGLFGWDNKKGIFKIASIDASSIYWSESKKLLFVAGENGIFIYTNTPYWVEKAGYEELSVSNPLNISENLSNTNNYTELWLGTLNEGIWQILVKPDFSYELDIFIGSDDGLTGTWFKAQTFDNEVLFLGLSGIMRFIDEEEIRSSFTEEEKETAVKLRGYFDFYHIEGRDSIAVLHLTKEYGKIWICIDNKMFFGENFDSLNHNPFITLDAGRIHAIKPVSNNKIWIAADDGLIVVNTDWQKTYDKQPVVNIRQIVIANDSLLFHSFDPEKTKDRNSLPFYNNRITFNFASSFNENNQKAKYSYMLKGFDNDWSDWSYISFRDYSNLREGEYEFMVRAKDIYGNISNVESFHFKILPPWYRTVWAFVLYGIAVVLVILLIVKLSIMRLKAKNIQLEKIIEKRTEEIRNQKDEIAKQHKIVVQQKEAITSSIKYASRIQNALVPQEDFLKQHLKDSFILYQPKDIVSGDFYWIKYTPPYLSIVAADCTGHGVPGAFMSMLGIAFLNEVAQREDPGKVSTVLEHLRVYMKNTLGQTGDRYEQKDGIVLALCTLNIETNTLYFAGANTPLWLIRDNELIEFKATRNPIGIHPKEMPFEAHTIEIQNGDAFYLFSDGYVDQFGGPDDQRIGKKAFRELLLDIYKNPMHKQKELLDLHLRNWMGEEFSQIDDILVMGFRI